MKIRNTEADTSAIGFRCPADLRAAIERQAAIEGISASDVIRRAVMFDVRRRKQEAADAPPLPRISMPSTPWTRSR
jgi:hypothetical protein